MSATTSHDVTAPPDTTAPGTLVAKRTQFDATPASRVVATPTCCSSCCCCLATMATVSSFSAQRVSFEGKLNEVRHRWIYITLAALFIPIGLGVALVLGIGVAAIPGNCVDEPTRFEGIVAAECVVQPTAVQIIGTIVLAVLVLWFALARVRVPRPIAATGGFVGVFTGVFVLEFIISLSGIGYLLMYRWPYYLAYAALIAVPLSLVYRRALRREASTPTVEALGPPHD